LVGKVTLIPENVKALGCGTVGRVRVSFVDGAVETGFGPVMGEGSANLSEKQSTKSRFQGPKSTNVTHTH
jgi:hypothetical protein